MTMQTTTTARPASALSGRASRHPHLPLFILLGTLSLSAAAATDAEERLHKAPMPHQLLGTNGRAHGMPVNPPSAWPHFVNGERIDTYSSINRTIQYISGLADGINQVDCSLLEIERRVASLISRKGVCDVDLIEKTAHGACDADGHASARAPARVSSPASETIALAERNAAGNPAAAALAAAMRRYGAGQRKVIAGLECDVWNNPHVWNNPLDPSGALCISRGGSFVAAHAADGQTQSGLELEVSSLEGVKLHAVDAKLDTMVDAAIFAPYLAGGFRIGAKGARK